MIKEDVETVVNKIEEIDSKIDSLTQEKGKITSEYYVELLEHDKKTIKDVAIILSNLKTEKATNLIEEYDVLGNIEEVISEIKETEFIKRQKEENS